MKQLKKWCAAVMACLLLRSAGAEGQFADFSEKYASKFLNKGVEWTENSYRSENMSVLIIPQRVYDSDVYIADIYLRTAECLQRSFVEIDEPGLRLCSWPKGDEPLLPFVYSDEVWTGVEYQVATLLLYCGMEDEALQIVEAVRSRYDGQRRRSLPLENTPYTRK